jgi:hypothetical protein
MKFQMPMIIFLSLSATSVWAIESGESQDTSYCSAFASRASCSTLTEASCVPPSANCPTGYYVIEQGIECFQVPTGGPHGEYRNQCDREYACEQSPPCK